MKLNKLATLLFTCIMMGRVKGRFDFTIRFYDYWNPTGLCAECGTNGVPVCCDDPQRTESCRNTGVFTCDTRFRFFQRPFNASLETAPRTSGFPFFTQGFTNGNHHTFPEGPGTGGFRSQPNPHTITNTSAWTGSIHFILDAIDRKSTNLAPSETKGIVDRFLINLDQLQLGANLTERATYTGIYGLSQLSMSFRVECSENYYGSDCTTFCEAVEGVCTCDSDGNVDCNEDISTESQSVSAALIGGVVGGVAGVLLLTLLVLMVVVLCMTFQLRKHRRGELAFSEPADNVDEQHGVSSHTQQTPGDDIELKQNIVYGVNLTTTSYRGNELEMNQAYGATSGEGTGPDSTGDQTDEYDYVR